MLDPSNFRIQKFDRDGKPLAQWGTVGSGNGQFAFTPFRNGLAVDDQDNVYVTDDGNHRVQKFDSTGQFLAKWGTFGTGEGKFGSPFIHIAADGEGNVYVADLDSHRIQMFQQK